MFNFLNCIVFIQGNALVRIGPDSNWALVQPLSSVSAV